MGTFYSQYPASSSGNNASVGVNETPIPLSSTLVGGEDPSGDLQPLQTDADGNLNVNIMEVDPGTGLATAANQVLEIAELTDINTNTAGILADTNNIDISTAAINTKTPALGQALMAASVPVTIASDQTAIPVSASALPLPAGAATLAEQQAQTAELIESNTHTSAIEQYTDELNQKTAGSDVTLAYDYRSISYVGATDRIDTIIYKTGGAGGTTVFTQVFGYDGSDRLTSITTT